MGEQLTLKSSSKKHSPIYKLHVKYEAPSGQVWEDKEIQGNFTDWFNVHGFIDQKAFKTWLAENISVIGMADPASKQSAEKAYDTVVNDVAISAVATSLDTPTSTKKPKKKT